MLFIWGFWIRWRWRGGALFLQRGIAYLRNRRGWRSGIGWLFDTVLGSSVRLWVRLWKNRWNRLIGIKVLLINWKFIGKFSLRIFCMIADWLIRSYWWSWIDAWIKVWKELRFISKAFNILLIKYVWLFKNNYALAT